MSTQHKKTPFEIHQYLKAELYIQGTSLAQIARDLGVSGTSMSLVSLGKHRSKRIELAIATALNKTPEEIWPDRYRKEKV